MRNKSSTQPVPVRFTQDSIRKSQTLLLSGYYKDRPKEVKVTKIGRTTISVELNGVEIQFDMRTGRGKRRYNLRIGTPEHYADDIRRKEITMEFKCYGIEMTSRAECIPLHNLEKILAVIRS